MKVRDLMERWEQQAAEPLTAREYSLRLPVADAARVEALAELYPRRSVDEILRELLGAALDELEEAMPYIQSESVISEDDRGDPIYADAGPGARFRELTRRHAARLESSD